MPDEVPSYIRQEWPTGTGQVSLIVTSNDPIPLIAFALIRDAASAAEALALYLREHQQGGEEEEDG